MLMDILMEALMNMDDETLDSVLESCDDEELEIIGNCIDAQEGVGRVFGNILFGPDETSEYLKKHGREKERNEASKTYKDEVNKADSDLKSAIDQRTSDNVDYAKNKQRAKIYRRSIRDNINQIREAKKTGDTDSVNNQMRQLENKLNKYSKVKQKNLSYKNRTKTNPVEKHYTDTQAAGNKYKTTMDQIYKANAEDAEKNSNSTSAQIGKVLHTPVSGLVAKAADALNTKRNTPSNGTRDRSKS